MEIYLTGRIAELNFTNAFLFKDRNNSLNDQWEQ